MLSRIFDPAQPFYYPQEAAPVEDIATEGGSTSSGIEVTGDNGNGNGAEMSAEERELEWRMKLDFADWLDARKDDHLTQRPEWFRAQVVEVGYGPNADDIKLHYEGIYVTDTWVSRFSEDVPPTGSTRKII